MKSKRLIKYYPITEYSIRAFRNQELFFAKPYLFNDCFDTSDLLYSSFPFFCNRVDWAFQGMIPTIDQHGICCFTRSSNVDSLRMWNLYGGAMNGFALEFNQEVMSGGFWGNVHLIPVKYRKHPLNLNNGSARFRIEGETFRVSDCWEKRDPKILDRLFEFLHVCKDLKQWASENESRMIIGEVKSIKGLQDTVNGYIVPLPSNPYCRIVIGNRVKEDDVSSLVEIARYLRIPVQRAKPSIIGRRWGVQIHYTKSL